MSTYPVWLVHEPLHGEGPSTQPIVDFSEIVELLLGNRCQLSQLYNAKGILSVDNIESIFQDTGSEPLNTHAGNHTEESKRIDLTTPWNSAQLLKLSVSKE